MKELLKRFAPFFKDYVRFFIFSFIGMGMAASGAAASAYLVKPVLDEIFINKDQELLYLLPYAVIFVYAIKGGGKFIQTYYTSFIGQDIVRRLRDDIINNIMTLDLSFFHKMRTGELISRTVNDIERVRSVVSSMIPEIIREGLTIVALVGVVIVQSPRLAFYALVIMPIALWPLSRLSKKMKKLSRKSQEKTSDITSCLSEIFNNIEIIKANSAEEFEGKRFSKDNYEFFKLNMKSVKTNELVSPIMETLGSIGVAVVIVVGGREVIEGTLSVGAFFSFTAALFMLYTPIKRISAIYNKMQDAVAASERIFFMLDQKSAIFGGNVVLDKQIESIVFSDVELWYGEKQALKGISFEVLRGEKIALVGDSGGGKSSIVNMILRFYDPSEGKILVNGTQMENFTLESLRKRIAIVTQRVYIFNDTVAANVAYGKEIDEEKVILSLKKAYAYDFVCELSSGIYTILDEFGVNLSGGQRQRIAIARAIYNNPDVLIFDEATSALDLQSEENITKAIEDISKDKIVFIIAHRLSTVKNADKIAVLKHGKVVCIGDDQTLAQTCEDYIKLKNLT